MVKRELILALSGRDCLLFWFGMDSTPFVAISSVNDAVFVVIRQQMNDQVYEIAMSDGQFSGLMYTLKAVERQFLEDRTRREANGAMKRAVETYLIDDESYDPTTSDDEPERKKQDAAKRKMPDTHVPSDEVPKRKKPKSSSVKTARDNALVNAYAMLFCEKFHAKIAEKCTGCCMGRANREAHELCALTKKKDQIAGVFDEIDCVITNEGLGACMKRNDDEHEGAVDKNILLYNVNMKRKLLTNIEKRV